MTNEEKKRAYTDNSDRIEVERGFSLAKRCYGLGRITTKLDTTTRSSIALSILAMNVAHLAGTFLRFFIVTYILPLDRQNNLPKIASFQRRDVAWIY